MSLNLCTWAWSVIGISYQAKFALLALADCCNHDCQANSCWPSIPWLCERTLMPKRSLPRAFEKLESAQLISRTNGGGRYTTIYRLVGPTGTDGGAGAVPVEPRVPIEDTSQSPVGPASLGSDAARRQQALENAVITGRIEHKRAQALLGSARIAATEAHLGRTHGLLSVNVSVMPNLEAGTARRFVNAMQDGLKRATRQQVATEQACQTEAAGRRQAERSRQTAELDRLRALADRQAVTEESSGWRPGS